MSSIEHLAHRVRQFRDARDWEQFHTLRNLIVSISIEAAELMQLTQWKSDSEIAELATNTESKEALAQECADVLIYLLLLADKAGIDLLDAAHKKVDLNEQRYPAAKARGKATKYTDL